MAKQTTDKSPICPLHIDLVIQVTEISTTQKQMVEKQDKMDDKLEEIKGKVYRKLDEIKGQLAHAEIVAVKDRVATKTEIAIDRLKIKPLFWVLAVAGVAFLSEGVKYLWHIVSGR